MKKPYIIAINAVSGGGKTVITKELQRRLPNSRALYFDDRDYDSDSGIDDICKWVEEGADANDFNLSSLADDIERLIKEKPDYIIMDYPFGYRHNEIAGYIDYSVFIDTPLDIALARRIIRDYDRSTSASIFDDVKQYLTSGRKAYLSGCEVGNLSADFSTDGSRPVMEIVTDIITKISEVNSYQ